ncbi:unnamed protein product [Clonostachys byssicola]|uniref:WSC domain-containing protein n=1 Tax=Clonostachys byssicola TaxID=160290 RepID=A0A9N9URB8_9HYPO|nr:unnamed protein product [Clonostachys byssicola]
MALVPPLLRIMAVLAHSLILLIVFSPSAHASGVKAPSTITAGQNATISITETIPKDSENWSKYDGYRLYLALTPPGWGTGPECWLANNLDLSPQTVNIVIPPDVAPNNTKIEIADSFIKKGSKKESGYSYSGTITFLGGNGTWSQRELNGRSMTNANRLPCFLLGCVRQCNDRYYTGEKSSEKAADDCSEQCLKNSGESSMGHLSLVALLMGIVTWRLAQLVL